eukprot:GHVH01015856.1.p3 GENE.GHVH01015856.1~~GHVH01015856.1.p3  ORF type:complete len:117 (+),score=18.42 GHVH01015856.1:628-978(+)
MVSIVIGGVYPLMTLFGFNIMECVFDWNRIEDKDSCMMTIFFNLAFLFFFGNGLTNTDGFGSFVSLILGCVTCWLIRRFTKDCDVVLPSFGSNPSGANNQADAFNGRGTRLGGVRG